MMLERLIFPRRHAQRTWEQARANYLDAKARNDDRDKHAALAALIDAQTQRLRTGS